MSHTETRQGEVHGPLVSVIVPAFNAERHLAAALDSALAQTYRDIEVVVVDDGSRDATAAIAADYARRDPRVRVLRQTNQGLAAARNAALGQARGEYIAPLDADDLWFPRKLEWQVATLSTASPKVGLVTGWSVAIDGDGQLTGTFDAPRDYGGWEYAALIYGESIGNPSVQLIRRSCYERVGGYDSRLARCEDLDLLLRMAEGYRFALVPEFVTAFRFTDGSLSSNAAAMYRAHREILVQARRRHPELPAALFRWHRSRFCYYLAWQCHRSGDYSASLAYLSQAVLRDIRTLRHPHLLRLTRTNLRSMKRAWLGRAPAASRRGAPITLSDIADKRRRRAQGPWMRLHEARLRLARNAGEALSLSGGGPSGRQLRGA